MGTKMSNAKARNRSRIGTPLGTEHGPVAESFRRTRDASVSVSPFAPRKGALSRSERRHSAADGAVRSVYGTRWAFGIPAIPRTVGGHWPQKIGHEQSPCRDEKKLMQTGGQISGRCPQAR